MGCLPKTYYTPRALTLAKDSNGLEISVIWRDGFCCKTKRFVNYSFYKNGTLVFETEFVNINTVSPIGGTWGNIQSGNIKTDMIAYLIAEGVEIISTDTLTVRVQVKNCKDEVSTITDDVLIENMCAEIQMSTATSDGTILASMTTETGVLMVAGCC